MRPMSTPTKRGVRAGEEDRWHRPARRGEQVNWPTDDQLSLVICVQRGTPRHNAQSVGLCCLTKNL